MVILTLSCFGKHATPPLSLKSLSKVYLRNFDVIWYLNYEGLMAVAPFKNIEIERFRIRLKAHPNIVWKNVRRMNFGDPRYQLWLHQLTHPTSLTVAWYYNNVNNFISHKLQPFTQRTRRKLAKGIIFPRFHNIC